MEVLVPAVRIPELLHADVVVCGGGCAGVAAAVAAARHGASVVLLERWASVGGMATNALVPIWHRSDRQKMVIYGLVEESVTRAEKHDWVRRDGKFPHAHETHWFDPEGLRIVWHGMLDEAGVRTFCHLPAGEPVVEGNRIVAVLCDTKRGRRAVTGSIFIDATGDGDIAAKAGCPFSYGRDSDGLVQGLTMIFALRGINDAARLEAGPADAAKRVADLMRELRAKGRFPPYMEGAEERWYLPNAKDGWLWNFCPVSGNPLDEEELTALSAKARNQIVAYLELWRTEMPGFEKANIGQTGYSIGIRESRRIQGRKTLTADMVLGAAKQSDALGHGVWMIDIHDPRGTGHTTYLEAGPDNMVPEGDSYHIPYGMTLNPHIDNLAVAGRCASSTHEAHSSVRVQTHCMVMGQGVGTAAAQAVQTDVSLTKVSLAVLQTTLRADGVYLSDVP